MVLLATAAVQAVLVGVTGSVALLADTVHNFADAFTAVPLWVAFVLGKRPATRALTYGYSRARTCRDFSSWGPSPPRPRWRATSRW